MVLRAQGEVLQDLLKQLETITRGPRDPRLDEADQLDAWAKLAPPDKAQQLKARASYLRTCVKYKIREGTND